MVLLETTLQRAKTTAGGSSCAVRDRAATGRLCWCALSAHLPQLCHHPEIWGALHLLELYHPQQDSGGPAWDG